MTPKNLSIGNISPTQGIKVAIGDLSNEWLTLIEACLENFAIIDLEGRIIYTNRGIPGMFSVRSCGKTLADCVRNKDRLAVENAIANARQTEGDKEIQVATVEQTPEMVSYAIRLCPIHRQDVVIGFLLSSHDITPHIENEIRLRSERNRAQRYLDIADVILVALDNKGNVNLINRKGSTLLGYSDTEILERNWFDNFLPARIGPSVKQVFRKLMLGEIEPTEYFENPVITRNGEERLIAWHNTTILDKNGKVVSTLSSGEDITERRKAEAQVTHYRTHLESLVHERTIQLEEANNKLQQAYQEHIDMEEQVQKHQEQLAHVCRLSTMAELATTISHELNQPLSALTNYARGIHRRLEASTSLNPEITEALDQIVVQAERAAKVLQRTRDFVTKRDIRRQEVALGETINRATELLMPKAKQQQILIHLECAPKLPTVLADEIQLEQVFVNLLSNAIEALEYKSGESRVIKVVAAQVSNQSIEISVHDNGPGMTIATAGRVFDAFMTTKADGMGMGLSISRSIVEAHGGRMWVDTDASPGAMIRIALPIKQNAV